MNLPYRPALDRAHALGPHDHAHGHQLRAGGRRRVFLQRREASRRGDGYSRQRATASVELPRVRLLGIWRIYDYSEVGSRREQPRYARRSRYQSPDAACGDTRTAFSAAIRPTRLDRPFCSSKISSSRRNPEACETPHNNVWGSVGYLTADFEPIQGVHLMTTLENQANDFSRGGFSSGHLGRSAVVLLAARGHSRRPHLPEHRYFGGLAQLQHVFPPPSATCSYEEDIDGADPMKLLRASVAARAASARSSRSANECLVLNFTSVAHAVPSFPAESSVASLAFASAPACALCHTTGSAGGKGTVNTPFGKSVRAPRRGGVRQRARSTPRSTRWRKTARIAMETGSPTSRS